ncbi:MAG: ATP-binding protein [Eubacterium sp.]|nr:ATP-binding protein [Eubacterium sp.]
MARTIAVGVQDFSKIIEDHCFYIDKTDFIKEWWENKDDVTLITRPRRFGKTLTMSMVEYFFSVRHAGRSDLFENLHIWKEEAYRKLQGTYPVIFLSFAGVKAKCYSEAYYDICRLISREYRRHADLLESGTFLQSDKGQFEKILNVDGNAGDLCASINQLSEYLYNYYGKKAVILLDEYDTPMQEAYVHGYWEEMAEFIRKFMNFTFKTNPYLKRGMMTGITRVSKESVFSDLNNLEVITVTSKKYASAFGFTEQEVLRALYEFGLADQMQEVKRWYDGFQFGNYRHIYNPWSVIKYLEEREFAPYWANTSSNQLIGKLIQKSDVDMKLIVEELLQGRSFSAQMDEEIIFSHLGHKKSAIWSLLLASGYLKILNTAKNRRGKTEYRLVLTNREIFFIFDEMVTGWFSNNRLSYGDFSDALLAGDKDYMNAYLNDIAMDTFSFFDTGAKSSRFKQPENFYHGFVLGMIADLRELYQVTSNRESGNGRYDVLLEPYHPQIDDGIILEFKAAEPETEKNLEDTVHSAIQQIIDKKYAAALQKKCRREKIRIYGFAFRGKEVLIDGGYLSKMEETVFDDSAKRKGFSK